LAASSSTDVMSMCDFEQTLMVELENIVLVKKKAFGMLEAVIVHASRCCS
jgi:hypothetical protein